MEIIPMVVDKNDEEGNYTRTADAKLFVNDEPIARTLTCKCGGGQEVHHNNMVVVKMNEKQTEEICVAMRGRNPERPTDRTPGLHTEQRLEPNKDGLVNTLTTVQKDNLVLVRDYEEKQVCIGGLQEHQTPRTDGISPTLNAAMGMGGGQTPVVVEENGFFNQAIETAEKGNAEPGDVIDAFNGKVLKDGVSPTITTRPEGKKTAILPCVEIKQATKEGSIKCKVGGCYDASYPDSNTRRGRVQEGGDVTPTLTAGSSENINVVETRYRIRKLTPKECWRLMGYTDTDFEKAKAAGVSNSQLYKQAGNAIVKQVLMAIFSQMGIKGVPRWSE